MGRLGNFAQSVYANTQVRLGYIICPTLIGNIPTITYLPTRAKSTWRLSTVLRVPRKLLSLLRMTTSNFKVCAWLVDIEETESSDFPTVDTVVGLKVVCLLWQISLLGFLLLSDIQLSLILVLY
jgi:hypothetical protein